MTLTLAQARSILDHTLAAGRQKKLKPLGAAVVDSRGALKAYAEWVAIPEPLAKDVRDQFFPKENLRLERLSGIEEAMADAVSLKFLPAPLTKQQQEELFKYYARGARQ